MSGRTIPPARIVFHRTSATAHFQLNRDADRIALAKLREREASGEVEIDYITLPPQIDQKGVPHVTALYWVKRLMTDEEIDKIEQKKLQEMAKSGAAKPSSQAPLPGIALTEEEKELLAPWKGRKDD